jgi:hypothetical protein
MITFTVAAIYRLAIAAALVAAPAQAGHGV